MTNRMGPPATPSAAAHAERIRARDAERAKAAEAEQPETRQTFEVYGERAAAGHRADEELRQQARLGELRARGVIGDDPEPEDAEGEYEEYEEEADEEPEAETPPKSTAELYAERERERQRAEHGATLAAHRSAGQVVPPPQGHQYTEQVAQQYRRTTPWPTAS